MTSGELITAMPVHDWSRVGAGTFHDFHTAWITHLKEALNGGLLSEGYYALSEQHAGRRIADILTLHSEEPDSGLSPASGAVATAVPRVGRKMVASPNNTYRGARRTLAIRHSSGHRVVALIEILSPANKDRSASVGEFVDKAPAVLHSGCHLLVVDLLGPGRHDPQGIHGAIWESFDPADYQLPPEKPLTVVSYLASSLPEAYVEHLAIGDVLTDMPVFLRTDWYLNAPLEPTYLAAYRGLPGFWREVIEGRNPPAQA